MNVCIEAAEASSCFEKNNTELKRKYLIRNIEIINMVMEMAPGYCGSFGTGYPFYVLNSKLEGQLPIINEQLRYNEELYNEVKKANREWICAKCLATYGSTMPDLKQFCKPCPRISDSLKPRKVINRLPDIDMWMVCADSEIENAKNTLSRLFNSMGMSTSDINPVQTIEDVAKIANDIEKGIMPEKLLPLDVHIIEYSTLSNLIDQVPFVLVNAMENEMVPYIPIHPVSLRKKWQYDDVAYNFILDFLYTLTPFCFEQNLAQKLNFSRNIISNTFDNEQLANFFYSVASESVKRRFETPQLKRIYERRIDSWRRK